MRRIHRSHPVLLASGVLTVCALTTGCTPIANPHIARADRQHAETRATLTPTPVLRQARYTLTELVPATAQRDLMQQVVQIAIPSTFDATVGDAIRHVLRHTGFRLCDTALAAPLSALPLPTAHSHLGPLPLRDALATLAGPAWALSIDEAAREVCIRRSEAIADSPPRPCRSRRARAGMGWTAPHTRSRRCARQVPKPAAAPTAQPVATSFGLTPQKAARQSHSTTPITPSMAAAASMPPATSPAPAPTANTKAEGTATVTIQPLAPAPPFAIVGLERRSEERFLSVIRAGAKTLADVQLLPIGATAEGWQLQAVARDVAMFHVNGATISVPMPPDARP